MHLLRVPEMSELWRLLNLMLLRKDTDFQQKHLLSEFYSVVLKYLSVVMAEFSSQSSPHRKHWHGTPVWKIISSPIISFTLPCLQFGDLSGFSKKKKKNVLSTLSGRANLSWGPNIKFTNHIEGNPWSLISKEIYLMYISCSPPSPSFSDFDLC